MHFQEMFCKFYYAISGGGRFLNLGMYKRYYKGFLKEQVLLLYLVKSGTPSCIAPDYDKKHENVDA